MTWSPPPDLLNKTIPQLLSLIQSGYFSKKALEWARKRIQELWQRKEYGFIPNPELASELEVVAYSDKYKRIKDCIGEHRFLPLIKVGINVRKLSIDGKGDDIKRIRNEVYDKHGSEGVKIINMGSTGVLTSAIKYISDLKFAEDYSQEYLAKVFESIVMKWKQITIFHYEEIGREKLKSDIINYMNFSYELFFVFGAGNAGKQAAKVIAEMEDDGEIRSRNYLFDLLSRDQDGRGRDLYSWVFRKFIG